MTTEVSKGGNQRQRKLRILPSGASFVGKISHLTK